MVLITVSYMFCRILPKVEPFGGLTKAFQRLTDKWAVDSRDTWGDTCQSQTNFYGTKILK